MSQTTKSQRILACISCQQRKLKCERKFPCANCRKSQVQCIPATLTPRRARRRIPERELLERVRKYEGLLRDHNISFDALGLSEDSGDVAIDTEQRFEARGVPSPTATAKSESSYRAKNIWHAMNKGFRDQGDESDSSVDELRETTVRDALGPYYQSNDDLLFGIGSMTVDLSTLHPDPVQIFKLWQIYLDNVNPLLKVTHTPTLQTRIIDAVGSLSSVAPELEALMFSIYCMSISSLGEHECQNMYGLSKRELSTTYRFGCQQALGNCGFLRSDDYDCLTAFCLYLISIQASIDPRSVSSMLGIAIRIAKRMGIHNESTLTKHSPIDAEMRRRLWWTLKHFDTRIGEMAGFSNATIGPTWDCKVPLNVNDSDLRPDMADLPAVQGTSSEALFTVVRSEMANFIRRTDFHLDFTDPALKPSAQMLRDQVTVGLYEMSILEKLIESKYLNFCDTKNPLHFMTIWTARAYIAKCKLLEHHSIHSSPAVLQSESLRDAATAYAVAMLECDTKLMTASFVRGFLWHIQLQFPFPAYHHTVQDLLKRPFSKHAFSAWQAMTHNFDARSIQYQEQGSLFFKLFSKTIIQAWNARLSTTSHVLATGIFRTPDIVSYMQQRLEEQAMIQSLDDLRDFDLTVDSRSTTMPIASFVEDRPPLRIGTGNLGEGYEVLRADSSPPGLAEDFLHNEAAPLAWMAKDAGSFVSLDDSITNTSMRM